MAREAELTNKSTINSNADEDTFFPKTSMAYQNEVTASRITPGVGQGFFTTLKEVWLHTGNNTTKCADSNCKHRPRKYVLAPI